MPTPGNFQYSLGLEQILGIGGDTIDQPTEDEQVALLALRDRELEDYVSGLLLVADAGTAGGTATLNSDGVIPASQLALGTPSAGFAPVSDGTDVTWTNIATQAELDAHLNDTVDAHDASAISVVTAGLTHITHTNTQDALADLDAAVGSGGTGTPTFAFFMG